MNAVRQKCRPKHQVLVLKCYPRFQKGVQDVKPNSSELSYLLYYATTRRSKLQKVGAFLEKKTASDVWRNKFGNVQVTLQILTALIEKAPRDLPLYAGWVLTILDTVLRSKDINMIEETLPTFEAYCKHQDVPAATTVSEISTKDQDIVTTYAAFAAEDFIAQYKPPMSKPASIRWRTAGLRAIKAVVDSEAFGADAGRQLGVVLPVILDNLYADEEDIFSLLQQKVQNSERAELEQGRKRGLSTTTVGTVDTFEGSPLKAASTTADADKAAEDDVRVLAVRCLKQIFAADFGTNRGQIRLATTLTLRFIAQKRPPNMPFQSPTQSHKEGTWATSLIETVARWTPVQDRFIIVVTSMEALIRNPLVEENLPMQLTLAELIDWLLSSNINMIGLSVMDVLLGFVQHILLLLQLGGRDSKITPHPQQSIGVGLFGDVNGEIGLSTMQASNEKPASSDATADTPSPVRQQLLSRLSSCIGDLATHIYYTDQVSDMIMLILSRLKPSSSSDAAAAAAIEDPSGAATNLATSVGGQEDPTTDGFFSFATARATALTAVKDVLIVANMRRSTGAVAETRSKVGLNVWEGTQWLLRDEDFDVRVAYVDAFLTWLRLETNNHDLQVPTDGPRRVKSEAKREGVHEDKLAKRAVSNASRGEKLRKPDRSKYIQLLHLAIYENALENPEDETNILLLHLLLSTALDRLGVNAARYGLPMILRLQDDISNPVLVSSSQARILLGSLVHGYLAAIIETFDCQSSRVGSDVQREISRRRQKGCWYDRVRYPALPLGQILEPSASGTSNSWPEVHSNSFTFFSNRTELIDEIAKSYNTSSLSSANSPPTSPGRGFSVPTLGFGYGFGAVPTAKPASEDELPEKVKDELAAEWTKDICIAAVERDSAQTSSITASKTGTGSLPRNFLAVTTDGNGANGQISGRNSPIHPSDHPNQHQQHGSRPASAAYGLINGLGSLSNLRRVSTQDNSPVGMTPSSSRDSTVRVNELKRALSVNRTGVRRSSPLRTRPKSRPNASIISSDSESMVSYSDVDGMSGSVLDVSDNANIHSDSRRSETSPQRENGTRTAEATKPLTNPLSIQSLHKGEYVRPGSRHKDDDIPPVPKIPSSLNLPGGFPSESSPVRPSTAKSADGVRQFSSQSPLSQNPSTDRGRPKSNHGFSIRPPSSRKERERAMELNFWASGSEKLNNNHNHDLFNHRADLGKLLAEIDVESGGGGPPAPPSSSPPSIMVGEREKRIRSGLSTPPY